VGLCECLQRLAAAFLGDQRERRYVPVEELAFRYERAESLENQPRGIGVVVVVEDRGRKQVLR
jgi:hypothetical protein